MEAFQTADEGIGFRARQAVPFASDPSILELPAVSTLRNQIREVLLPPVGGARTFFDGMSMHHFNTFSSTACRALLLGIECEHIASDM